MAVSITQKPNTLPSSLVLKRDSSNSNAAIRADWKNPSSATDENNPARWQQVEERWWFNASKDMAKNCVKQNGWARKIADKLFITGQGVHNYSIQYYNRSKYHPLTEGRYLKSVKAGLWTVNSKGWIGDVTSTYTFKPPRKPTVSMSDVDPETGVITTTIMTNAGTDAYERYDTYICETRAQSANMNSSYTKEKIWYGWVSNRNTTVTLTNDWANLAITPGQWIRLRVKAYSRGLAGNSSTVTAEHVFAYPAVGSIRSIRASSLGASGVVIISVSTNSGTYAPVDTIKLQRLANTAIGSATSAATASGWTDVEGASDSGWATSGFTDQVVDALPDATKHTWYRLVTTHDLLTRTSTPVEAKCLYRAKDQLNDDKIKFSNIATSEDGTAVNMLIGWKNDDSTGTEVTWSEHEDAWESNKQPESITLTWEDSTSQVTNWAHSAHVTIRGLEEGKPCYIRARRFLDDGNGVTYGPWCTPPKASYPVTLAATPEDVVLWAPTMVERGKPCEISWEFTGPTQKSWIVYKVTGSTRKVLLRGNSARGALTIGASYLKGLSSINLQVSISSGGTWADSQQETVTIVEAPELSVSTNATLTTQPLRLSLHSSVPTATVTAYVTASATESGGVSTDSPSGVIVQAAGDIVWGRIWKPAWQTKYVLTGDTSVKSGKTYFTRSGSGTSASPYVYTAVSSPVAGSLSSYYETDGYDATVTLPRKRDIYDGGSYDVSASSMDRNTGLTSQDATAHFDVAWTRQARVPGRSTSLTVDQDELSVAITPAEPSNAEYSASYTLTEDTEIEEGKKYYTKSGNVYTLVASPVAANLSSYYERTLADVCDIYRVTMDEAVLVAEDVQFGTTVVDRYAPFGSRHARPSYRICTRTINGDMEWSDYGYTLRHDGMRINWADKHVDLPYNIKWSSGWQKSFSLSKRWDGSRVGQWDGGATRNEKLSTDVIRIDSWETSQLLGELARHDGPCFVRTSLGEAYQANVEVTDYSGSFESSAIVVSIDATETDLTEEFMIGANGAGGE